MRSLPRLSAFGGVLLMCLAGPASAQIMRITTDNPTNNTVLNASGTTLLTITLDPTSNSITGLSYCNWSICPGGPAESCWLWGDGPTCNYWQSLEVEGYYIVLTAVGGAVTWGTFTPADASQVGSQSATSTQVRIDHSFSPSVSGGPFTLGTILVRTSSPFTTHIEFARYGTLGGGTGLFLKDCWNSIRPGFPYLLGDRSRPCEGTDWYDAYGAISPMDDCLARASHGQCEVCCKAVGGDANTCAKFCNHIGIGDSFCGNTGGWDGSGTLGECSALYDLYVAALGDAVQCDSTMASTQCTQIIDDSLTCPCPTFVNPANTCALATMTGLKAQWDTWRCDFYYGCTAGLCPGLPATGVCQGTPGTCPLY
jgi:hypothetical protein